MRPGAPTVRESKSFLPKEHLGTASRDPEGGCRSHWAPHSRHSPPAGTQGSEGTGPTRGHRAGAAVPWGWSTAHTEANSWPQAAEGESIQEHPPTLLSEAAPTRRQAQEKSPVGQASASHLRNRGQALSQDNHLGSQCWKGGELQAAPPCASPNPTVSGVHGAAPFGDRKAPAVLTQANLHFHSFPQPSERRKMQPDQPWEQTLPVPAQPRTTQHLRAQRPWFCWSPFRTNHRLSAPQASQLGCSPLLCPRGALRQGCPLPYVCTLVFT